MSDSRCARMMLESAARDAAALEVMREPGQVSEEVFGFHLQQVAEKAFKAWIAILGGLYELTHSLEALSSQLEDCGADEAHVARFRSLCDYTPYPVEFRYQGVADWALPIDRGAAIALVGRLLDHVGAELKTVEDKDRAGRA